MRIGKPVRATRARKASEEPASSEVAAASEAAPSEKASEDQELRRTTRKRTKTKLYGEDENKKRSQRIADKSKEDDEVKEKASEAVSEAPEAKEEPKEEEEQPARKLTRGEAAKSAAPLISIPDPVLLSKVNLVKWNKLKEELQEP